MIPIDSKWCWMMQNYAKWCRVMSKDAKGCQDATDRGCQDAKEENEFQILTTFFQMICWVTHFVPKMLKMRLRPSMWHVGSSSRFLPFFSRSLNFDRTFDQVSSKIRNVHHECHNLTNFNHGIPKHNFDMTSVWAHIGVVLKKNLMEQCLSPQMKIVFQR